jgi:hypothetical protein
MPRMGTSWEWLDDSKTIAVMSMQGDWSQADLEPTMRAFWTYMEQQPHIVDVIVDLRGGGLLPIQPINGVIWIAQHRPANAGRVVFIVRRKLGLALLRAINQTIQRIYPRFQLFGVLTREEAVQLLASSRIDETIEAPVTVLARADNQSPSESPQ